MIKREGSNLWIVSRHNVRSIVCIAFAQINTNIVCNPFICRADEWDGISLHGLNFTGSEIDNSVDWSCHFNNFLRIAGNKLRLTPQHVKLGLGLRPFAPQNRPLCRIAFVKRVAILPFAHVTVIQSGKPSNRVFQKLFGFCLWQRFMNFSESGQDYFLFGMMAVFQDISNCCLCAAAMSGLSIT